MIFYPLKPLMTKKGFEASLTDEQGGGRKGHLGRIALVLQHRGGTWQDLGDFLTKLYANELWDSRKQASEMGFRDQSCRHNKDGDHYLYIHSEKSEFKQIFDRIPYSRAPCLTVTAAGEKDKAPGLRSRNVLSKLRTYLEEEKGKRKAEGSTSKAGQDDGGYTKGIPLESESASKKRVVPAKSERSLLAIQRPDLVMPSPGQTKEDLEALAQGLVIDGELVLPSDFPDLDEADQSDAGDDDEDDEGQDLAPLLVSEGNFEVDVLSDPAPPAGNQSPGDSKIRAYVLGYLLKFADSPALMRKAFKALRQTDKDPGGFQEILHLCGCGIKAGSAPGCVAPQHLTLGDPVTNASHRDFHGTMREVPADSYPALLGMLFNGKTGRGRGLF